MGAAIKQYRASEDGFVVETVNICVCILVISMSGIVWLMKRLKFLFISINQGP